MRLVFKHLCFIILLFFSRVSFLNAQKLDKIFQKLDIAFLKGDIKSVKEEIKELRSRIKGKTLIVQDSIQMLYAESRYQQMVGNYSTSEEQAQLYQNKSAAKLGSNSAYHLDVLLNRATVSHESFDFFQCRYALNQLFEFNRISQAADSELVFRARFLEARNEIEMGCLKSGAQFIDKIIFKAENRLLERREEIDRKGRSRFVKLSSEDLARRKHELMQARVLKARLLRMRGEYKAEFQELESLKSDFKKKKIKLEDQSNIEFLFEYAQYHLALGDRKSAILKIKEALYWCGRRDYSFTYAKTHEQYFLMLETIVGVFVAEGDFNRARDYIKEYREIIKHNYPESQYFEARLRVPLASDWSRRDDALFATLKKSLKDIEDYHLPPRYAQRIFSYLKESSLSSDSLEKAGMYLERHSNYLLKSLGANSVFYHEKQCELADFYAVYSDKIELSGLIFQQSLHQGLAQQLSEESTMLLDAWNREGVYYELKDQHQKSINDFIHVLQVLERKFGKESVEVALQKLKVANAEFNLGEFSVAEEKYLSARDVIGRKMGRESPEYKESLRLISRLYITTGRYEEAAKYLARSLKNKKNTKNILSFNGMDEEIMLLLNQGLFSEAQEKTENLINGRMLKYGKKDHRSLILPYQIGANVYASIGNYAKAEAMANRACQISKVIFGDSSMNYFRSLGIFCRVQSAFGDYDRAMELAGQSLDGMAKYYGDMHVEVAQPLEDMAMVYLYKGQKEKVLPLLTRASAINEKSFGDKHPRFAESLQFLAAYYIQTKKFQEAFALLDKADVIWREKLGTKNVHSAEILMLRGEIDWEYGRISEARDYFVRASEIYKNSFNGIHPKYVAILSRISQSYFVEGNRKKALKFARLSNKQNLMFVRNFFPSMSEREKAKMWTSMKTSFDFFYTLALQYQSEEKELIAEMYDVILNTKAILLGSSIRVRDRIMESGNPELKAKYSSWIRKKEEINAAVEMGAEERKHAGIELTNLEREAEELEARLGSLSEDFREAKEESGINWKSVRSSLKPRDAAVEIVRFRHFQKQFTDSVLYAALIITPKTKTAPQLVIFPKGNLMEKRFIKYYRNSVRYGLKDTLSYSVFWKPMKSNFADGGRIFFSPDGVFNELNPEAFQESNGAFLIDSENFFQVSNTKDIIREGKIRARSADQKNLALLLGNPDYYPKNQIDSLKISLEPLPGTKVEINGISEILKGKRWEINALLGSAASESSLKAARNPRILHVATHGYFLENKLQEVNDDSYSFLRKNKAIDNPLLRSGLYLNEAGTILDKTAGTNQPQVGEGILTAYEAMNLNLNSTELVVLSACETGRGEVQVGEGVYGLQRAFQVAGARSVIMSLFMVPDEATQELMSRFYENWINKGMDLRQAFSEAKKELKKTRPEPLYWGSFVMVGAG